MILRFFIFFYFFICLEVTTKVLKDYNAYFVNQYIRNINFEDI